MTSRDRRAIVVGGALVATAVLGLRVVPGVAAHLVEEQDRVVERTALHARARDELANAVVLRDSAARLTRAIVALAPRILTGTAAEEAGADLAGRMNHAASGSSAKLERIEPVADTVRAGRLQRVRARAILETDVRGLAALLRRIEGDDAVLTVEQLTVTTTDPASPERAPELLRVEVTVSGWFLGKREPGAGSRELARSEQR